MDYPNRGKAIIINNKKFNPGTGLNERNGTDQDASALCCRLSELDFDVDLFHNLKAEEIKVTLQKGQEMRKSSSFQEYDLDCVFLFLKQFLDFILLGFFFWSTLI